GCLCYIVPPQACAVAAFVEQATFTLKGWCLRALGFLAVCILLAASSRAAEPVPLPPAPLTVVAAPAGAYPRVKSKYSGFDVDPVTQAVRAASREEEAVLFPRCGGLLEFQ